MYSCVIRRHNKTIKFNQLFDWYFQCLSICFTLLANCFESQQTLIHTSIVVQIVREKKNLGEISACKENVSDFFGSTSAKAKAKNCAEFSRLKFSLFFVFRSLFILFRSESAAHGLQIQIGLWGIEKSSRPTRVFGFVTARSAACEKTEN